MTLHQLTVFSKTKSKQNRIFEGSYLGKRAQVREVPRITIDVSTDCATERTIYDLICGVGFDLQMCGTRYIISILIQTVNMLYLPVKTKDFYQIAADKFGHSVKAVELAITRAIENVNSTNLMELNRIFGCTVLQHKTGIRPGALLSSLCARLVMLKAHGQNKTCFG